MNDNTPVIILGFANDRDAFLQNLAEEQTQAIAALTDRDREGSIKVLNRRISTDELFALFRNYDNRVSIFHYAGHAGSTGLLLEAVSGENQRAHVVGLAQMLGRQTALQLVFLNGCATQGQAGILLAAGVKAVIATAVPIADAMASRFAIQFYQWLSAGFSIKRAFQEAKATVASDDGGKRTIDIYRGLSVAAWQANHDPSTIWGLYVAEDADAVLDWALPQRLNQSDAGNPLLESLGHLLSDVPDTIYLPRYRSTVEALGEPGLARAQNLREMLASLLTLGDGTSTILSTGIIQFLLRLEQEPTLAADVKAWLDRNAAAMAQKLIVERQKLAAEGRILLILVSAAKSAGTVIGGYEAKLCTSDGAEITNWPGNPAAAKRTEPLTWVGFEAEVQSLLDAFLDEDGALSGLEIQFAVDTVLLGRPFHTIACTAGGRPIGEQVAVVLRLRKRIVDPFGQYSKTCRRELQALRGRFPAELDWIRFPAGRVIRGGGPFLAEFALPHHGGMQTGDAAASSLARLLDTGAAYLFLPHSVPTDGWDAVADKLRTLLHAEIALSGFPGTIKVERAVEDPLAIDSSLLWDDPDCNPFTQAVSLGTIVLPPAEAKS